MHKAHGLDYTPATYIRQRIAVFLQSEGDTRRYHPVQRRLPLPLQSPPRHRTILQLVYTHRALPTAPGVSGGHTSKRTCRTGLIESRTILERIATPTFASQTETGVAVLAIGAERGTHVDRHAERGESRFGQCVRSRVLDTTAIGVCGGGGVEGGERGVVVDLGRILACALSAYGKRISATRDILGVVRWYGKHGKV